MYSMWRGCLFLKQQWYISCSDAPFPLAMFFFLDGVTSTCPGSLDPVSLLRSTWSQIRADIFRFKEGILKLKPSHWLEKLFLFVLSCRSFLCVVFTIRQSFINSSYLSFLNLKVSNDADSVGEEPQSKAPTRRLNGCYFRDIVNYHLNWPLTSDEKSVSNDIIVLSVIRHLSVL